MKNENHSNGKPSLYQTVTNQIIDVLESHTLTWDKPWISLANDGKRPHNAISGRDYSGLNQILLSVKQSKAGYPYSGWLTYNQINTAGGRVLPGVKSSEVFYNQLLYYDEDGKIYEPKQVQELTDNEKMEHNFKKRSILRYYHVFNIAQTIGLPDSFYEIEQLPTLSIEEKDEKAEILIGTTDAKVVHKPSNEAYYNCIEDVIYLPERKQFKGKTAYYETILHELGHWTGHASRLKRDLSNSFGSEGYAKEELIAELGSSFICSELGFSKAIKNNAAYIQSWISILKADQRYIFKAAKEAEKAANFINSFVHSK